MERKCRATPLQYSEPRVKVCTERSIEALMEIFGQTNDHQAKLKNGSWEMGGDEAAEWQRTTALHRAVIDLLATAFQTFALNGQLEENSLNHMPKFLEMVGETGDKQTARNILSILRSTKGADDVEQWRMFELFAWLDESQISGKDQTMQAIDGLKYAIETYEDEMLLGKLLAESIEKVLLGEGEGSAKTPTPITYEMKLEENRCRKTDAGQLRFSYCPHSDQHTSTPCLAMKISSNRPLAVVAVEAKGGCKLLELGVALKCFLLWQERAGEWTLVDSFVVRFRKGQTGTEEEALLHCAIEKPPVLKPFRRHCLLFCPISFRFEKKMTSQLIACAGMKRFQFSRDGTIMKVNACVGCIPLEAIYLIYSLPRQPLSITLTTGFDGATGVLAKSIFRRLLGSSGCQWFVLVIVLFSKYLHQIGDNAMIAWVKSAIEQHLTTNTNFEPTDEGGGVFLSCPTGELMQAWNVNQLVTDRAAPVWKVQVVKGHLEIFQPRKGRFSSLARVSRAKETSFIDANAEQTSLLITKTERSSPALIYLQPLRIFSQNPVETILSLYLQILQQQFNQPNILHSPPASGKNSLASYFPKLFRNGLVKSSTNEASTMMKLRRFLEDFAVGVPASAGSDMARWLMSSCAYVDAEESIIAVEKSSTGGITVRIALRDQNGQVMAGGGHRCLLEIAIQSKLQENRASEELRLPAFKAITNYDSIRYQSITMMAEYEDVSFEELRLIGGLEGQTQTPAKRRVMREMIKADYCSSSGSFIGSWQPRLQRVCERIQVYIDGELLKRVNLAETPDQQNAATLMTRLAMERNVPRLQRAKQAKCLPRNGVRVREHASLSAPATAILKANETIEYSEELRNADGCWLKLVNQNGYVLRRNRRLKNRILMELQQNAVTSPLVEFAWSPMETVMLSSKEIYQAVTCSEYCRNSSISTSGLHSNSSFIA